jgi:5-deoxy-D-glucuronate isomerase
MQRSCHQSSTITWLSLEISLIPDARILSTQHVLNGEAVDGSQMVRHSKLLFKTTYSVFSTSYSNMRTLCALRYALCVAPNVADLNRAKTRQSASDVAAHKLGQDEAYLIVREILFEASTAADGVLWCERSDFGRFWFASLGPSTETSVFP